MDDDAIRALLSRLARPHPSGGEVVERAALLAAGADFPQVMAWITDHDGQPESAVASTATLGLHGTRIAGGGEATQREPQRYVLPSGSLS